MMLVKSARTGCVCVRKEVLLYQDRAGMEEVR